MIATRRSELWKRSSASPKPAIPCGDCKDDLQCFWLQRKEKLSTEKNFCSNMSKATKRKHVVKEVLLDYVQPSGNQRIVRVLGSPGNNLHEIETAEGERFLVSMPTKFRKNIWIKRGDFVIVDPIAEGEKVKAEICFIIYKDHQRLLQKEGLWPQGFANDVTDNVSKQNGRGTETQSSTGEKPQAENSDTDSEDDSDLFVNTNRVCYEDIDEESDSEENSEEDGENK